MEFPTGWENRGQLAVAPGLALGSGGLQLAPESRRGTTFDRGRQKKRTRTASADNTGAAAAGLRCVCLRAREGASTESRIRYRSISPGTGSGALLRFLYFIPPGSGPIKSALQYACGGTRLAFLVPGRVRTPARQLDARREKKKEAHRTGEWVDGCSRRVGERIEFIVFWGEKNSMRKRAVGNRVSGERTRCVLCEIVYF